LELWRKTYHEHINKRLKEILFLKKYKQTIIWKSEDLVSCQEPGQRNRYSDWLRAGQPKCWSSSPSPVHVIQTDSGAHSASYPMVTGALSREVKRPGREADHSPPTSAEVKKIWIYTSIPPYAFMA
jgi:hypothetical protein